MYSKNHSVSPALAGATLVLLLGVLLYSSSAAAATEGNLLDFTNHWAGFAAVAIFVIAYAVVIGANHLLPVEDRAVEVLLRLEPVETTLPIEKPKPLGHAVKGIEDKLVIHLRVQHSQP